MSYPAIPQLEKTVFVTVGAAPVVVSVLVAVTGTVKTAVDTSVMVVGTISVVVEAMKELQYVEAADCSFFRSFLNTSHSA